MLQDRNKKELASLIVGGAPRDAIERAIKKGAGIGDEKLVMEHIVFEGYAPHKVAVIVEALPFQAVLLSTAPLKLR